MKRKSNNKYILVPIQFFIDALINKYLKELRFFLLLKLLYTNGKTKFNKDELSYFEYILRVKSRKTIKKYIDFLLDNNWISYNSRTGYYILHSFDKIRKNNNWEIRLAFSINFDNYYYIKAVTGAVIFGYLHKDFWRKVKKEKSVQIKGCTYHFLSPKFNYKEKSAPISIYGASKIFGVDPTVLSRLKKQAVYKKLITLEKTYSDPISEIEKIATDKYINLYNLKRNIVYHNNEYRLQLIDVSFPLFNFSKRKSINS